MPDPYSTFFAQYQSDRRLLPTGLLLEVGQGYVPISEGACHIRSTRPQTARPFVKDYLPMCSCNAAETVLDVRQIMPRMRHPLIFSTFDQLEPGASFLVVNDHDPRPLLYHFGITYPGQFDWDYVATGPDIWKVRISREAD